MYILFRTFGLFVFLENVHLHFFILKLLNQKLNTTKSKKNMAPSQSPQQLRPSPSTAVVFVDAVTASKDYFKSLFSHLDSQKVMPIVAFAATLGIGSAAYYFGQQNKSTDLQVDEASLSTQRKSKILKRRNKKSSRVAFQNTLERECTTKVDDTNVDDGETGDSGDAMSSENVGLSVEGRHGEDKLLSKTEENDNSACLAENNVLILKQCPRGRKTPCIAPFPLKLETFLRVHKLKYELDFNGHAPRLYGSPWIRFNTEDITDSQNVIHFLVGQYNLKTERELTAEQRSMATAYTHLLENHLYWGIALWRWVYDGARSLKDIQLLPKKTQDLIPDVCKTVEQAAWFHGIGKMTPEEVKRAVIQDLRSLSGFLGTKDYFLNTHLPTELDCTAFGMLAQFLWNMHGPFHEAVVSDFNNLRDFCWRIRLNYWPDWEECLNNTQFYNNDPYPTAESIQYPY